MIQPPELKLVLPMKLANDVVSTTTKVWDILVASRDGDLEKVKTLVSECPELIYAQYNYTPPIHFAVREGHIALTEYLLQHGAHDPAYRIYPFLDNLLIIAQDREHNEIAAMLQQYMDNPAAVTYRGDNGGIVYDRSTLQQEFEQVVDKGNIERAKEILQQHPEFALDNSFFWGEGILMMVAKVGNYEMVELLMNYGAKVPDMSKWCRFYYFEKYDSAVFLMERGMNPNHHSWHHVTLLHDMAQAGDIQKAALLLKYGAAINPIEEEYCSTPLGMAVRWGNTEMVDFLLKQGADPNLSGAAWSTPLAWAQKKGHSDIETMLRKAGAR